MGMYTGYRFRFRLRAETPDTVIGLLKAMMDTESDTPEIIPQHPSFLTRCWRTIFTGASAYFFDDKSERSFVQDEETGMWLLTAFASNKGSERDAALLLDWLKPWLLTDPGEVLALARYEERYGGNYDPEHLQYWLVDGQVVVRYAPGDVDEVELPITLPPDTKHIADLYFEADRLASCRPWMFAAPATESDIRPPAGAVMVTTSYPDVRGWYDLTTGQVALAWPSGFDPSNRAVFKRRNKNVPLVKSQARGYYKHSHKGRQYRQGIPRPRPAKAIRIIMPTTGIEVPVRGK